MYGLLMLREYIDEIFNGKKNNDVRRYDTNKRGKIVLVDGKNGYHMDGGLLPVLCFFKVNQEGDRVMNEYGSGNVK